MSKITKTTIIQDAIKAGPHTAQVLKTYNMGCVACSGRMHETVEWCATTHGVNVEEFLARLNEKEGKKEK